MAHYVNDEYRVNELSTTPGGVTIIKVFPSGHERAYPNVKSPAKFCKAWINDSGIAQVYYVNRNKQRIYLKQ